MADEDKHKHVDIGFAGGQAVSVRVAQPDYDAFRGAVREASGWYELNTADGPISIDLRQVAFVKTTEPEHRVGFSGL